MKKFSLSLAAVCSLLLAGVSAAFAAPKDYQVTGPIVSMTDTTIVVMKGKEQWELAKDATTKGAADLKVGDKVTIHYTMTANTVDVSAAKAAPKKAEKSDKSTKMAPAATATPEVQKPAAEAAPGSSPSAH